MRFDKLTTKFQQALADAQSAALARDAGFIEPAHLLAALLDQEDGGAASLLQRAGVNVASLGLMATVTCQLGRAALVDWVTVGLGLVATALFFRLRVNSALCSGRA